MNKVLSWALWQTVRMVGLNKSGYQVNSFIISPQKHMLWVLIRYFQYFWIEKSILTRAMKSIFDPWEQGLSVIYKQWSRTLDKICMVSVLKFQILYFILFIPHHTIRCMIVAGYYRFRLHVCQSVVRPFVHIFRFRTITWVKVNGFSPNLVYALILWRSR